MKRREITWQELYQKAREAGEARAVEAAAGAAVRRGDVAGMAEFAMRYARLMEARRQESPLSILRRGDREAAMAALEAHTPGDRTLWLLLMAWEMHLAGQSALPLIEQVAQSGARLSKRHAEYGGVLLQSVLARVAFPLVAVAKRILPPSQQAALVARLLMAGSNAEARQLAEAIDDAVWREQARQAVTTSQVQALLQAVAGPGGDATDQRSYKLPTLLAPTLERLRDERERPALADAWREMSVALWAAGERAAARVCAHEALALGHDLPALAESLIASRQFEAAEEVVGKVDDDALRCSLACARILAGGTVTQTFKKPEHRDAMIAAQAQHQGREGEWSLAFETAMQIEHEGRRAAALTDLLEIEARPEILAAALDAAMSLRSAALLRRLAALGGGDDARHAAHVLEPEEAPAPPTDLEIAEASMRAGDVEGAREIFSAAIQRNVFGEGWRLLHRLALLQEPAERAQSLRTARAIIDQMPERDDALAEAAVAQVEAGESDMALETLAFIANRDVAQVSPVAAALATRGDRVPFYALLMPCAFRLDGALQWCRHLLRLHPDQSRHIAAAISIT